MKKIFIIISAFLIFTAYIHTQEKYKIECKFEKGKTYNYLDVSKGKIVQEMMGQEERTDIESETIIKAVADSVSPDGGATLCISLDSAKVTLIMKKGDKKLDLSEIIGKRVKIKVSKSGKVISRETLDPVKVKGMNQEIDIHEIIQMPLVHFSENEVTINNKWDASWTDSIEIMGRKAISQ
jgi:hypothetical protein